ncbi:LacI family DNA-binding transcriptional regulator [Alloscardovia venturai]|uniref:LacI family DNA-binding transcriptional regulator n=1 Tax=Alloscardovia venturai TaxID=1769421 RepID=A0ABW2Y1P1_9BIFI
MSERQVSIVDVAQAAGVSYQTVSRVINKSGPVRDKTRQKVLEAIDRLHYHPSWSAKALKTQRTRTIGVIASQINFSGPLLTLGSLESMAREHGLFVSLATLDENKLTPLDFNEVTESFTRLGVEAIIIVAPTEAILTLALENSPHIPLVIVTAQEGLQSIDTRTFDEQKVKFVFTDVDGVSRDIAQRMVKRGTKTVYFLSGPHQWRDAVLRENAARRACAAYDMEFSVIDVNDWASNAAYDRVTTYIRHHGKARFAKSAIWAVNDALAVGALRAFYENGLYAPRDMTIVGYDNMQATESLVPSLTTVDPNYTEVGSSAMRMVLDMLGYTNGSDTSEVADAVQIAEDTPRAQIIKPRLIVRESL